LAQFRDDYSFMATRAISRRQYFGGKRTVFWGEVKALSHKKAVRGSHKGDFKKG
jgi:hypothetical protein